MSRFTQFSGQITPKFQRGIGHVIGHFPHMLLTWIHTAVNRSDGSTSHDDVLRCEANRPILFPLICEGKLGLETKFRPQPTDESDAHWAHITRNYPDLDLSTVGRDCLTITRSYGAVQDFLSMARGDPLHKDERLMIVERPSTNDNDANVLHMTRLFWGFVDPNQSAPDTELGRKLTAVLGGLKWYSLSELSELRENGELYGDFTLAVIADMLLSPKNPLR